jgi:hypothetical protein
MDEKEEFQGADKISMIVLPRNKPFKIRTYPKEEETFTGINDEICDIQNLPFHADGNAEIIT